ncbi:HdeD family acid-resistance protein [Ancylobacter moscoviensis]|nr:protease [Ancylobacter moscoviensis]
MMLKLAFLLIGSKAFKSRWYVLSMLGGALILAAAYLSLYATDSVLLTVGQAIGFFFVANGAAGLSAFLVQDRRNRRYFPLIRAVGLIVIGALILDWPIDTHIALGVLFAIAFAVDGTVRLATALVVRFPGWRAMALCGAAETVIAVLIFAEWPLPHNRSVAFCISLLVALTGWLLVRVGFMFRTLESEVAILNLPIFTGRGWYDNAPVLVETGEEVAAEHPMIVHVWTPVGSASEPERRLLVDRYIAAVDGSGVISTGHSALEMPPDLYISHYPATELERSGRDFIAALRGTVENDLKGRFQPSYAYESDWWCPADAHVEFRNFNPMRLRSFWVGYRQDDTYNLTNRNCSVVVAHALDAALEGSLTTRFPWLRLIGLLGNPDIWVASMIRTRAHSATWTPGLVLDYANALARVVEKREVAWSRRFSGFVRRLRAGATGKDEAAA